MSGLGGPMVDGDAGGRLQIAVPGMQINSLCTDEHERLEVSGDRVEGIQVFASQGSSSGSSFAGMILPLMIGLVFAGVGGTMMYFGLAPIVFDKRRGEYWKGRTAPYEAANREGMKHYAKLSGVRALQIIRERCTSKNSSYYSYELNLVLDDGSRLNVVDHGNLESLREDADRLAAFLGVAVWDGTEG